MSTFTQSKLLLTYLVLCIFGISCQTDRSDSNQLVEPPAAPEYYQYFHELTHDPALGIIPAERLFEAKKVADQKFAQMAMMRSIPMTWEEQGPSNVGGRTRAIVIDKNDPSGNTVFAGSVSGGLWKTQNFKDPAPNWEVINDFLPGLAITSIVQHPTQHNIFYFATGEPIGDYYGARGVGIFKSTDGGDSWNLMPTTQIPPFERTHEITINEQGVLFVATNNHGLQVSYDEGQTWSQKLGQSNFALSNQCNDVKIAADGTIFAAMGVPQDGIYRSDDQGNTWTKTSTGLPTAPNSFARIQLAPFASDPNIIFALVGDRTQGQLEGVYKSINRGDLWTKLPINTGLGTQAYWNLNIGVHPTNQDIIAVGLQSGAHTIDGGQDWKYMVSVHVDHHVALFDPNDPNYYIDGNDGGVWAVEDASQPQLYMESKNSNYNVTQFYTCAIHPEYGRDEYLGGTQDNGTWQLLPGPIGVQNYVTGGDGAFCAYDEDTPELFIQSYQLGRYTFRNTSNPNASLGFLNVQGMFVNPSAYDSEHNILYAFDSENGAGYVFAEHLFDPSTPISKTKVAFPQIDFIFSMELSPSVPDRLYIGNNAGKVFRIDQARSSNPQITQLTPLAPIGTVNHLCADPNNEQHLLATIANYGMNNIYESFDGGLSWIVADGDLPDMPVYKALFAPNNSDQAIIATDLGVWTTENLDGGNTIWMPSNGGLANVRVMDLDIRKSDKVVLAGTHGRGLYTSDYFKFEGQSVSDLSLNILQPTEPVEAGDQVTIEVRVQNDGPDDATNIEVHDFTPLGISISNVEVPAGSTFTSFEEWLIPNLPAGTSTTLILDLTIDEIYYTVSVLSQIRASDNPDPDSNPNNGTSINPNEDDEAVISFIPKVTTSGVDLALEMSADNLTPSVYSNVTFTLTLQNTGIDPATDITVYWPGSAFLAYVSDEVSKGSFSQWTGLWQLNDLQPGEEASIEMTLFTLNDGEIPLFAQVVSQNEEDADSTPNNNTSQIPNEDDETRVVLNDTNPNCILANPGITPYVCDDQGTSDPNDDTFSFTINPTGSNLAPSYNLSGYLNVDNIPYGTPYPIGPIPIAQGSVFLTIQDDLGTCMLVDIPINPPNPCSDEPCEITGVEVGTVFCTDNGTPDPSDDLFFFTIQPEGTNLGDSYDISGDLSESGIPYGGPWSLSFFQISDGPAEITITDESGDCSRTVTVNPPAPCSFPDCTLLDIGVNNLTCFDNSTDDPDDDLWSFTIQPTGTNLDATYNLSGTVAENFISYDTPKLIGPRPISNGFVLLTIQDGSTDCELIEVRVDPPAPCSSGGGDCTNPVNLALNRPAQQSSTLNAGAYTGDASKAVDGNSDGRYYTSNPANASVSHTQWEHQSYWQVELEETSEIQTINIYNRTDGSGTTKNFYVLVSDTPFGNATLSDARSQSTFEEWIQSEAGSPTSISLSATGKYVRIQAAGGGFIALAEVEVLGCSGDGGNECTISDIGISNIRCDDQGTPNPDDDRWDFSIQPTGNNLTQYDLVLGNPGNFPTAINLSYDQPYSFNPRLISAGDLSITIVDQSGTCQETVIVNPPPPCSTNNGDGADLELSIQSNQSTYTQWENYTITLTVANTGDEGAEQVSVKVPQPNGVAYTASNTDQGYYFPWGNFTWSVGTLEAGQQATLTLEWFTLVAGADILNYAEVLEATGTDPDSSPGNGNGVSPNEDDEAAVSLSYIGEAPSTRTGRTESFRSLTIREVYPNPASHQTHLTLFSKETQSVRLEIYDHQGQQAQWMMIDCKKGPNSITLDIQDLDAGVYNILVFPEKGLVAKARFLKVRL